jgi:hypothetical protein
MLDYDCPYCGKRMIKTNIKKFTEGILDGLPTDEERLMEVVEYYDTGYGLHPLSLWIWVCEDCAVKSGAKYSNFIMFKDGYAYGFNGKKWEEIKEKVSFD